MATAKQVRRRKPSSHYAAARESAEYLAHLGQRIRDWRARRGLTRKVLAAQSGVSERFLAQVESGQGNASILNLRQLAVALNVRLHNLLFDGPEPPLEFLYAAEALRNLRPEQLQEAHQWMAARFRQNADESRRRRIALIGLRGAGKSTLGPMIARQLGYPFFELDRLIEKVSGVPLSSIFDLYGQSGFRRLERRCLEEVLAQNRDLVLATGGSLVSEPSTFQRLLSSCYTVWLRADPEDHMKRVIAQGDMRPMAENPEAMSDLKRILLEREPLYSRADLAINTSEMSPESVLQAITQHLCR
jgi:XRE family aerobic/anaerobic benzoate catabolism transcriptional regulator